MTQPEEPVSEADAGTRDKPREDARSIVDAMEEKLDKEYPDHSEDAQEVPESEDVEPDEPATDTTGREPPD